MKQQMELSLESTRGTRAIPRRHRRSTRAHWWFDQMRQVVAQAPDIQPVAEEELENAGFGLCKPVQMP